MTRSKKTFFLCFNNLKNLWFHVTNLSKKKRVTNSWEVLLRPAGRETSHFSRIWMKRVADVKIVLPLRCVFSKYRNKCQFSNFARNQDLFFGFVTEFLGLKMFSSKVWFLSCLSPKMTFWNLGWNVSRKQFAQKVGQVELKTRGRGQSEKIRQDLFF